MDAGEIHGHPATEGVWRRGRRDGWRWCHSAVFVVLDVIAGVGFAVIAAEFEAGPLLTAFAGLAGLLSAAGALFLGAVATASYRQRNEARGEVGTVVSEASAAKARLDQQVSLVEFYGLLSDQYAKGLSADRDLAEGDFVEAMDRFIQWLDQLEGSFADQRFAGLVRWPFVPEVRAGLHTAAEVRTRFGLSLNQLRRALDQTAAPWNSIPRLPAMPSEPVPVSRDPELLIALTLIADELAEAHPCIQRAMRERRWELLRGLTCARWDEYSRLLVAPELDAVTRDKAADTYRRIRQLMHEAQGRPAGAEIEREWQPHLSRARNGAREVSTALRAEAARPDGRS